MALARATPQDSLSGALANGGLKPVGTVAWSVVTHVAKKVETDTPNQRQRWAVTPIVQLMRLFVSKDGSPPDDEVVYTASDTVRGNWMPLGV